MDAFARLFFAVAVVAGAVQPVAAADTFPTLPVRTLSDHALRLPADLPPVPVLFIVGFSRAARMQTQPWGARIHEVYSTRSDLRYYQAAIIEDVPRLMRGVVSTRIRSGVPAELHDRFLLIPEQAQQWKQIAEVSDVDSAYLLLLDRNREIVWRSAGPLTEHSYAALAARLELLTAPAP